MRMMEGPGGSWLQKAPQKLGFLIEEYRWFFHTDEEPLGIIFLFSFIL